MAKVSITEYSGFMKDLRISANEIITTEDSRGIAQNLLANI